MVLKKSPGVTSDPTPPSQSNHQVDELVALWEDDAVSVDDKLAATFRGLGYCLDANRPDVAVPPPARARKPRK